MGKKRILVVDDESGITGALKVFLEGAGLVVSEQNDPRLAVETAREFVPNLILLDYRMPGMNGDKLAVKLLRDEVLGTIPIIFMSGSPKEEILQHLPRKNFPILPKPLPMQTILVFLENQKSCPVCGAATKLRMGRTDSGKPVRIWGCRNAPKCSGSLPFEDEVASNLSLGTVDSAA